MPENNTILVVDDDANDIFILRRAFFKAGLTHKLVEVSDGQQAIAYLRGQPPFSDREKFPLPRLVLLDLKMPLLNGFDVLAWLSSQPDLEAVPVVILSASELGLDKQKAREMGADDYQTKQHSFDDMVKVVQGIHQRWLS